MTVRGGLRAIQKTGSGTATLVNQGTIAGDTSGRTLYVRPDVLTNQGLIKSASGGNVSITAPTITNVVGNALVGGIWKAAAGSTLSISGATITTNQATIELNGPGSNFTAINGLQSNQGTFSILGGRTSQRAATLSTWAQ